jgi:hypothetical protein
MISLYRCVSLTIDLCRALGWLQPGCYVEAEPASVPELLRFHASDYVEAVQRAEASQSATAEDRLRFNLGVNGNPIYGEVFRRPATACGASLQAARRLHGGGIVHNPAGGTHHGQPARAEAKLPDALGNYVNQQLLVWNHFGCFLQELSGHISQGTDSGDCIRREVKNGRRAARNGGGDNV